MLAPWVPPVGALPRTTRRGSRSQASIWSARLHSTVGSASVHRISGCVSGAAGAGSGTEAWQPARAAAKSNPEAEAAVARTTEWAARAQKYFVEQASRNGELGQWQFGIVQGATFGDLRRESARQLLELDFPGYAVGGLAVGEPHALTCEMTGEVTALLPRDRPRYLMGVGKPEQIAEYVALGIDMMDCVLPTRAARHACLYTSEGRVLIKNARYAQDQRPPDSNCSCSVCRR